MRLLRIKFNFPRWFCSFCHQCLFDKTRIFWPQSYHHHHLEAQTTFLKMPPLLRWSIAEPLRKLNSKLRKKISQSEAKCQLWNPSRDCLSLAKSFHLPWQRCLSSGLRRSASMQPSHLETTTNVAILHAARFKSAFASFFGSFCLSKVQHKGLTDF